MDIQKLINQKKLFLEEYEQEKALKLREIETIDGKMESLKKQIRELTEVQEEESKYEIRT